MMLHFDVVIVNQDRILKFRLFHYGFTLVLTLLR